MLFRTSVGLGRMGMTEEVGVNSFAVALFLLFGFIANYFYF